MLALGILPKSKSGGCEPSDGIVFLVCAPGFLTENLLTRRRSQIFKGCCHDFVLGRLQCADESFTAAVSPRSPSPCGLRTRCMMRCVCLSLASASRPGHRRPCGTSLFFFFFFKLPLIQGSHRMGWQKRLIFT